jgi:hypothetical protein
MRIAKFGGETFVFAGSWREKAFAGAGALARAFVLSGDRPIPKKPRLAPQPLGPQVPPNADPVKQMPMRLIIAITKRMVPPGKGYSLYRFFRCRSPRPIPRPAFC